MALSIIGVACSGPLDKAPEPVRSALGPFLTAGYACAGPETDQSEYAQWQCDRTSADGVLYFVVLDADESRVKQVTATVDQSQTGTASREVAGVFFDQVANIAVGAPTEEIKLWVRDKLNSGGQKRFGQVLVTLGELKPVDHLVLSALG